MRLFTIFIILFFQNTAFSANVNCYDKLTNTLAKDLGLPVETALSIDSLNLYSEVYTPYFASLTTLERDQKNRAVISSLDNYFDTETLASKHPGADLTLAKYLYSQIKKVKSVQQHLSEDGCPYDPHSQIGFCFGVAYASHQKLQRLGFPDNLMLKLWLVGPFDNGRWSHHVTLLIKARDEGWWVLDPGLYPEPVLLKDYYQKFSTHEQVQGKLILIPSKTSRLLSSPTRYGSEANFNNLNQDLTSLKIDWPGFFRDSLIDADW